MSTTIGGIIDAGDEFHIYHSILLGQMKTFGIKKAIHRFCPNTPSKGWPSKFCVEVVKVEFQFHEYYLRVFLEVEDM